MVIRFINMEADLRVQYVSFPPPTSDFFGSKFLPFLGIKLGQFFLICFSSVMSTNFIIFGQNSIQFGHHKVCITPWPCHLH